MKKPFLILILILTLLIGGTPNYGNSAEPPGLIILVSFPPDDLKMSLLIESGTLSEPIVLKKEKRSWEAAYRFFYHMTPMENRPLSKGKLVVETEGQRFEFSMPSGINRSYNQFLTLDLKKGTLSMGTPPYRAPILVGIRLSLTLIIEGAVFYLLGLREKKSWMLFLMVNLVTQGWLNTLIEGPNMGYMWFFGFIFAEGLILVVEWAIYLAWLKEFTKKRASIAVWLANMASLLLGGCLLTVLPI